MLIYGTALPTAWSHRSLTFTQNGKGGGGRRRRKEGVCVVLRSLFLA